MCVSRLLEKQENLKRCVKDMKSRQRAGKDNVLRDRNVDRYCSKIFIVLTVIKLKKWGWLGYSFLLVVVPEFFLLR